MRKHICIIMCALLLMTFALPVFASESSSAEETTATSEIIPSVESVIELIENLNADNPDPAAITEARNMYEMLTMAQKTQVVNIDKLVAAEASLQGVSATSVPATQPPAETALPTAIPAPASTEDSEGQKSSTKFAIHFDESKQTAAIVITHMTDSDNDGIMEAPRIVLTSPNGTEIVIEYDETAVRNTLCEIDVERTEEETILRISRADFGNWTVQTSNRVLFRAEDYTPSPNTPEFQEVIPGGTSQPSIFPAKKKKFPIGLVVFALVVVGAVILIKKLPSLASGGLKKDKKPKNNGPVYTNSDKEIDPYADMSDEETIAAIRAEWEKHSPHYEDPTPSTVKSKENPGRQRQQQEEENDPRLFFTQENRDSVDVGEGGDSKPAVEPLNGKGFFARSKGNQQ